MKNKLLIMLTALILTLSMILSSCAQAGSSLSAEKNEKENVSVDEGADAPEADAPAIDEPAIDEPAADAPALGESEDEPEPTVGSLVVDELSADAHATATVGAINPTVNLNGTEKEWSLDKGISEVFDAKASNRIDVNIPVSQAGTYSLGFETNLGITRTFTSGSKQAVLSMPKTVFTEGEPIPVYYSTSGLDTSSTKKPWIGIAKDIAGKDKYITWEYVEKNSSGVIDATLMTGARQEATLLQYVVFPAGEYKIYFIDENAALLDRSNWLHSEPIYVTVLPKGSINTTVTRVGTIHGTATISTTNNLFCAGSQIDVRYTANNLFANFSTKPWLAFTKWLPEYRAGSGQSEVYYTEGYYYHHWAYTDKTASGTVSFSPSNASAQAYATDYKSLPEGSYAIHYVTGSCIDNISWCTTATDYIGINLAPQYTIKASVGSTSILNTTDTYGANTTKKDITVTDADVANGYVTVEFTFESLKSGTPYYFNLQNVSLTAK